MLPAHLALFLGEHSGRRAAVGRAGRDFSVNIPRARLTVDGSPRGMVAHGVIHATVSPSCTLPVFLAGAYVTWYGWVEYRVFHGDLITGGPVALPAVLPHVGLRAT